MQNLKNKFIRYFHDCEDKGIRKLIHNPSIANISDEIQGELIEMKHNSDCKDIFETRINLEVFWSQKAISFPKIPKIT